MPKSPAPTTNTAADKKGDAAGNKKNAGKGGSGDAAAAGKGGKGGAKGKK
jgi:hypothetical protein